MRVRSLRKSVRIRWHGEAMNIRYVPVLFLVLAAALMASGCTFPRGIPGPLATEEFDQVYPLEGMQRLDVENINGAVRIRGWEQPSVSVHAVKATQFGEGELDKVTVSVETGDGLTIRTLHPQPPARVSVNYEIQVPPQVAAIRIDSSNGEVQVEGVSANTVAATSNGRILLRNISESVEARTSNGGIEIRDILGSVQARTSNARITVVNASVTGELETSNGEIAAEIRAIPGDITLRTSNGRIRAALAPDLNATVVADTSNARIQVQGISLETEERTDTHLRGTTGIGDGLITLRTSNGEIILSNLPLTGV